MKTSIILCVVVAGVWCLPAKLDDLENPNGRHHRSPVLVKDFSDIQVQVEEIENGHYTLKVYQNDGSERILIPTKAWKVPNTWRAPGSTARVVHAELLSNGDVVVVLFSHEKGLELIVLPLGLIQEDNDVVTEPPRAISFPQQAIIFPNFTVPWHPTVPTPPETWEWVSSDTEVVTPSSKTYPTPEKSVAV